MDLRTALIHASPGITDLALRNRVTQFIYMPYFRRKKLHFFIVKKETAVAHEKVRPCLTFEVEVFAFFLNFSVAWILLLAPVYFYIQNEQLKWPAADFDAY